MEVCSAWKFIFIWIKLLFIWKILHETRFETETKKLTNGLLARIDLFSVVVSLQVANGMTEWTAVPGPWGRACGQKMIDAALNGNTIQTCRLSAKISYFIVCRLKFATFVGCR